MECLKNAKYHAKAIKYCHEYAGARGYDQALAHFHQLSSIYTSSISSSLPTGDEHLISEIYESAQSMIEQIKEREEAGLPCVQKKWMHL